MNSALSGISDADKRKWIMRANLITFILMIALAQVSAATFAQKLTYIKQGASLQEVFKEIKTQTGYNVLYSPDQIDVLKKVNVNFKQANLEKVLERLIDDETQEYAIVDNNILIKKKEASFLDKARSVTLNLVQGLFQSIDVRGRVVDSETGNALAGATVRVKGTSRTTTTNDKGEFFLSGVDEGAVIVVNFIGYSLYEIKVSLVSSTKDIILIQDPATLKEVEVVSTGYEKIPAERATGAFTFIENELFNRIVSPDILSRLNGVTSSLLFDLSTSTGNPLGISVRGRSTLFSNTQPLIILDNFPFEGDLNTINPNDIENVTVLKDAAAASIWGSRAGNGVIVLTTKHGKLNQQPIISFNGNLSISKKPDLFFEPQLSSSEYIDIEKYLFNNGYYNTTLNNDYATISPVVDILNREKKGELTQNEAISAIDRLRSFDIRNQLGEYFYRQSVHQQYHANVSGGNSRQLYFLSLGYDDNLSNNVGESNDRITVKGNNTYKLFNDRLNISADLNFSASKKINNHSTGYSPLLPYEQVADEFGSSLAVLQSGGLRESFISKPEFSKLLDWTYRPLDELRNEYNTSNSTLTDYRLNIGLDYKLLKSLSLGGSYQFYKAIRESQTNNDEYSFRVRDLLNSTSEFNSSTGEFTHMLPSGNIFLNSYNILRANSARVNLILNKLIDKIHQINGIAGYEVREDVSNGYSNTIYGYRPDLATSVPLDLTKKFPYFYRPGSFSPNVGSQSWTADRYISYFLNGSYSFKGRYVFTGSFRKDESNLFGVKANQKGVPLWSAGLAWNLHNESFFSNSGFPNLKLRATYGFNGNVNKNVSAYLTSTPFFTNTYNSNIANVVNPPNDALRWERVENINLGIDFSYANRRITGSIDYYIKNGKDLIGQSPYPPQTGIVTFTGNVADSHTYGFDVTLNTTNIDRKVRWETAIIFNLSRDRITDYFSFIGSNQNIIAPGAARITPLENYPINAIFAYRWGGLNSQGAPQGRLGDEISTDYTGIRNSTNYEELDFFGSGTPTTFGAVRNTISYRFVEFSFNLTFKSNYFVRNPALSYQSIFLGNYKKPDFNLRWEKTGDERYTDVPALIYPANSSAESFYSNSAINVQKGDHIRLQDVRLNISLGKRELSRVGLQNLKFFVYATNLGVVWKSSSRLKDPDIRSGYPNPRNISLGINTNL